VETWIAFNDSAALIGDSFGSVRTIRRDEKMSPASWKGYVLQTYREPGHWMDTAEEVETVSEALSLGRVSSFRQRLSPETHTPLKVYRDESAGLRVKAAFVNEWEPVHWVVADLNNRADVANLKLDGQYRVLPHTSAPIR